MPDITYVEIDERLEKKLYEKYGDWLYKYNCLPKYDGCYNVAAMSGDEVAGFATLGPQQWTPPLDMYNDMFIHCIDVDESFRRQGIARHLVGMMESWAKGHGYRQIRAWSSYNAVAALHMWYALDYAMCPAQELIYDAEGKLVQIINGYRYAKILNPTSR